ncbi:MAG: PucR family transcriptional regulator [Bacillus sp. (in: firmicutes)]
MKDILTHKHAEHDAILADDQEEGFLKELHAYISENDLNGESVVLIAKSNLLNGKNSPDVTYVKLLYRSIFEQYGFLPFSIDKGNQIVFILLNKRSGKNVKERLNKAVAMIDESEFIKKIHNNPKMVIAVGKFVNSAADLEKSYLTAKETLRIQQNIAYNDRKYFYEDLHLYRLIFTMNKHMNLDELVLEYLQPVIQYDQKYNGNLLQTLKIYLECNGSKQETAKKLYIVRQTLYHRLKKIEALIGPDFMEHEKKVALEFMLLAYEFLTAAERKKTIVDSGIRSSNTK